MINNGGSNPVSVWRSDIDELRKRVGLSVRDLAAKTGYSSTYCGYAINGPTIPAWNVCEAVLIALGVEPAEWIPRWQAARRAQGQPTETGVKPGELATAGDGRRGEDEPDPDDVADEAATEAVIHNSNHVSVVINPPADGVSAALSSSSSPGRAIRILGPTATRWTVGTGVAVAIVAAVAIGNSGGERPAPAPAAASAPVITTMQVTREPAVTESSAPAPRTVPEDAVTSSDVAEPVTAAAATSETPAPPTAPAVVPPAATGAGTDPAAGVTGGHCKRVTGVDVRVFSGPQDTQQTWTSWTRGTLFWAVVGAGTSDRYATYLRNGQTAWVTKDSRYVGDASGCP